MDTKQKMAIAAAAKKKPMTFTSTPSTRGKLTGSLKGKKEITPFRKA